jgi:hypothetical protein
VQQSVLLVREKYEATKVLEVGDKVKKLGRTHKWLLSLASRSSEMHEQIRMLTLLFRCRFKQLFQSLDFFIKIDQWIL